MANILIKNGFLQGVENSLLIARHCFGVGVLKRLKNTKDLSLNREIIKPKLASASQQQIPLRRFSKKVKMVRTC